MATQLRLLGISAAIRGVESDIQQAARSHAKVLVTGESGVGKEIVARSIHSASARRHATLLTVNCAGIPDSLLESELFGHVRGSFTDAHRDRAGLLERAHGGTLFLDEIGEMSLRMQALLLRFVESGELQRVGADRQQPHVDVRIVAATHRPLARLVAEKTFREDLYYRLNVIHIDVPPLRERRDDVPLLLEAFLQQFACAYGLSAPEVSAGALRALVEYPWPGNVRELRNVAERLVLRCTDGPVTEDALPADVLRTSRAASVQLLAPLPGTPTPQALFEQLVNGGASFWSVAYEPFMARDLTRRDLRDLVRMGLKQTRGNYKLLVKAFNMAPEDYKRFLGFLRKYQCHVPFQMCRMAPVASPERRDYAASA